MLEGWVAGLIFPFRQMNEWKKPKKIIDKTIHVPWSTGGLILRRMYLGGKGVIPCAKRAALVLRSSGSGAALTESAVARVARTERTVVNFIVTKDKGVKWFLDISFQKVDMFYIWAQWGFECCHGISTSTYVSVIITGRHNVDPKDPWRSTISDLTRWIVSKKTWKDWQFMWLSL